MSNNETPPIPSNSPEFDAAAGPTEQANEAAGPAAVDAAIQMLAELEARHAEVSDAYLRAKAEAENMRRRADEEVAKARKFAIEGFAESLLPVKDSLEAAIATPDA